MYVSFHQDHTLLIMIALSLSLEIRYYVFSHFILLNNYFGCSSFFAFIYKF